MRQCCEICESYRPDSEIDPAAKLEEVVFDDRRVLLCRGHARIAEKSGVASLEQLRAFYGSGRRSFLDRRARETAPFENDRRLAPRRRANDTRV